MRRLVAFLVIFTGVLVASPVNGAIQSATFAVELAENSDWSGDEWRPGVTQIDRFSRFNTNLVGGCERGIFDSGTWDQCVSRVGIKGVSSLDCLVFYQADNYASGQGIGGRWAVPGPHGSNGWVYSPLGGTAFNDQFSSYRRVLKTHPDCSTYW